MPKKFIVVYCIQNCIGTHGKCSKCFYFDRRGMKAKSAVGKIFQSAHVLADGDAIAQQDRVSGTRAIGCVVDVVGVDPDEGRA